MAATKEEHGVLQEEVAMSWQAGFGARRSSIMSALGARSYNRLSPRQSAMLLHRGRCASS
eukprot:10094683-Lingulodinium_polyedra.AAC.1